jgi:hypothetical protein
MAAEATILLEMVVKRTGLGRVRGYSNIDWCLPGTLLTLSVPWLPYGTTM